MLFGKRNGTAVRLLNGRINERYRPEVQHAGVGKPRLLQLFRFQQHVCAGLPVEREVTVAVRFQGDERQRRVGTVGTADLAGVHAYIRQRIHNVVPESVPAQLGDQTAVAAQLCRSCCHIRRCAAADTGELFHFFQQAVPLCRNKINECFSNCQ